MCNSRRRNAFTLIEVLIVVIIMAVLAATIIPQFTTSTRDAKQSSVKFNMHTLRAQIELYKAQHNGTYPTLTSGALPQLTSRTNQTGGTGTDATAYPLGPYIDQIPENPNNGKSTIVATNLDKPTAADDTNGWYYNATTGGIWPSDAESYKEGGAMYTAPVTP